MQMFTVVLDLYICQGRLSNKLNTDLKKSHFFRREADSKLYVKYEVIGANHVAVPTHFFKVVVSETSQGQLEMEAYVLPNQVIPNETPLTSFQVSIKTIFIF